MLNTTPSLFSGPVDWRSALVAILLTVVVAWLAALVAARGVRRLLKSTMGNELSNASPLVRAPLRLVSLFVFVIVSTLVLFPAFQLVGSRPRTGVTLGDVATWAYDEGIKVFVIVLLAWAVTRIVALLVRRFEYEVSQGTTVDALERGKRARTLGSLVNRVATIAIWSAAALMVLDQFHINIAPVLTTAGIAGLAVGFGAQTLVRDIISGFFLILEDQVRVGDVASINNVGGLVEQINLRTVVLRDEEGAVHVFPNGAITTLANRSKDFSYYVITLALPYSEDPDRVIPLLKTVGEEMEHDPQYGPFILAPIEVYGVDAFADWSVQVKLRIKTMPLKQWEVGRELRKRIRRALSQNGVQVPFPALAAAMPATGQPPSPPREPDRPTS